MTTEEEKELLSLLNTCKEYVRVVSEGTLGDHLDDFANYDLLDDIQSAIEKMSDYNEKTTAG